MTAHLDLVAATLCNKPTDQSFFYCLSNKIPKRGICANAQNCKIAEKSSEQISYVAHPYHQNSFLEACAGSGKTEVVGLKAAYEMKRWEHHFAGIAILTFTNNAADVISERISQALPLRYPHFVGTFDSWLHRYIANPFAHKITKYKGINKDCSIRIVENRSTADFLNAYQTKYSYSNPPLKIKANEFTFNMADGSYIFSSANENADRSRMQIKLRSWEKDDLSGTKERFWEAGFATYQDIEYICYQILKTDYASDLISKRFPLILIDECQDLSWAQIQIIEKLLLKGTNLHLVGDLYQAIYSFRRVDPKDVQDFIARHKFSNLKLTRNFRSLQPIVDLSSKIVHQSKIEGVKPEADLPVCFYLEYKKTQIQDLPDKFINILMRNGIRVEKCAILTRNNNTVAKLRPGIKKDLKLQMLLPIAIQIWKCKNIDTDQINDAISALGKFLAFYYFGSHANNRQLQYCPEVIKSTVVWRLFLASVLEACCKNELLADLECNWASWAKNYRTNFEVIVVKKAEEHQIKLNAVDTKEFRTPQGEASNKVLDTLGTIVKNPSEPLRITNFHQTKGETFDAVMIVSSPTNQGKGEGFWKNWLIDPKSENARFAYVASTRPKNLLIWAIPEKLESQDRECLTQLGFETINAS